MKQEQLDLALVAIAAAIVYAGDGLEALLIAREVAEEKEPWSDPAADGATPRMLEEEAVRVGINLLAHAKTLLGMTGDDDEG